LRPTDAIVISAGEASLVAVGYLLSAASKAAGEAEVAAAVGSAASARRGSSYTLSPRCVPRACIT